MSERADRRVWLQARSESAMLAVATDFVVELEEEHAGAPKSEEDSGGTKVYTTEALQEACALHGGRAVEGV